MSSVRPLSQVPPGAEAQIRGFDPLCQEPHRLREMGLLPGTTIKLVRWAPLGDPLEVKVRGYHLSLRKAQADHIEVIYSD
ncbi:MAG: ferrous iron transport protein A [Pedosphaera sp.]|nr:ferrous iron transport protein A [Pedosphaera sp.]